MNTHEAENDCCMGDEIEIAVGDLIGGDPRHADFMRLECLKIANERGGGDGVVSRAEEYAAFVLGEDEDDKDAEIADWQEVAAQRSERIDSILQANRSLNEEIVKLQTDSRSASHALADSRLECRTLREALSRMEFGHKAVTDALYSAPVMRLKRAALDYRYSNASLHSADSLHRAAVNYGLWAESQTGHVGQRLGN